MTRLSRLRPIIALAVLLFLVGCGDEVTARVAPTAFHFILRADEFRSVASNLFGTDSTLWGHALRALYYSALTLARVHDLDGLVFEGEGFHRKVWGQATAKARGFFENTVRPMRVRYDYEPRPPSNETSRLDVAQFLKSEPEAFKALVRQAREDIDRQYHKCPSRSTDCSYCRAAQFDTCIKSASLTALDDYDERLRQLLTEQIPEVLRTELQK